MLKVYISARTTPSSTQSLSSTDVAVALKTLGAKGPYFQPWRESCHFKIARVNQCDFQCDFVAAISQGFPTCLKLDATSARQKLHRVAATKIACVNGPLEIPTRGHNSSVEAEHVRDVFKDYFVHEGTVEWQWERC